MAKQEHRPQDNSLDLILAAVKNSPAGLTRSQIATALDRSKTPHLINLIEGLVEDGFIRRQVKIFGNGVEGYIYTFVDAE